MNIQLELAVSCIEEYEEWLDFRYEWLGYNFKELSYAKWATNEILNCLSTQNVEAPLTVIEIFRDKMKEYSNLNVNARFIFSVAYDTAEEIIDMICSTTL